MDQIIITSDRDAVRKVKQYFPTFDEPAAERLKKGAIIRYLREQEPYKEAFEKEYRRQWLKNSLDIYHMLLESGRDESRLSSGLKVDSVEDKAHMEFYLSYSTIPIVNMHRVRGSSITNYNHKGRNVNLDIPAALNKIKWGIVDKYQDRIEV